MYSVPQYLARLKLAKRSPRTIDEYQSVLRSFARFLDVPVEDLHNNLLPDNLINYAAARAGKSERGNRVHLGIIHRFYSLNGVAEFDELDINILKPQRVEEQDDKPLTLEALQKMMDLADPHAKAIIAVLISTGMRAGECCKLTLADVDGDIIKIPNRIAKNRRGGVVFLTSEASEYLSLWLKDRPRYLKVARTKYYSKNVPKNDQRLFCIAYPTMRKIFSRLYDLIDGERGRYWSRCTIHSCRKYFRTQATQGGLHIDIVEHLMRHSGYLSSSYVRLTEDQVRQEFHAHEDILYITRPDRRHSESAIAQLQREKEDLEIRVRFIEKLVRRGKTKE